MNRAALGLLRQPRDYLQPGQLEFTTGVLVVDASPLAGYAQTMARRLQEALAHTNQSELSRRTGVARSTFRDTVMGHAWPDSVTVMLLEDALGIDLWPTGPERRAAKA